MNLTTYFIITGVSDHPALQLPIFLVVLLLYLLTISGNMTILLLVCLDHQLHTPMYFFLAKLSVLDICCSTLTLHKILIIFILGDNTISVLGCLVQVFIYLCLICDELLLLTAMSYDRYVAICDPLRYHQIMNGKVCGLLATMCGVCALLEGIPVLIGLLKLVCFNSNKVNHFFCDIVPMMKLSCSDMTVLQLYVLIVGSFITGLLPFVLTFISYVFIISIIIRIRSSSGQRKAFYTCSSHLTVVILLYTTLTFQYLRPNSTISLDSAKFSSLFNTAAVPVLNPLIYTLKNNVFNAALKRRMRCSFPAHIKKLILL